MKRSWKSPKWPGMAQDATTDKDRLDRFTWDLDDVEFEPRPPGAKPLVDPKDRAEAHRIIERAMRRRAERERE